MKPFPKTIRFTDGTEKYFETKEDYFSAVYEAHQNETKEFKDKHRQLEWYYENAIDKEQELELALHLFKTLYDHMEEKHGLEFIARWNYERKEITNIAQYEILVDKLKEEINSLAKFVDWEDYNEYYKDEEE